MFVGLKVNTIPILNSVVRLKNSQSELFSMIEQLENSRQEKNKILQVSFV